MRGYAETYTNSYAPGLPCEPGGTTFRLETCAASISRKTACSREERITTHLCDSTDYRSVQVWMRECPNLFFDVVIDDGSHYDQHQLATLTNLWPRVKPGGY
jgi:cephalosporin hydroxylase